MKLSAREDTEGALRMSRSARARQGAMLRTEDVHGWLAERAAAHRFHVERIPFDELRGWSFRPGTGDLAHAGGRFFTVEGLRVTGEDPYKEWHQPIINQPEVGILGLLAKEFDGVPHFLMQAKMEPGNRNLLQLSPTVQATRSNFTGAHHGAPVRYLDHFTRAGTEQGGRVLADVIQSEHGSWFFHKGNRNMIVETRGPVPLHDDFHWLTLGQLHTLLHHDNLVNMDARTVLACAPLEGEDGSGALHTDGELLSWLTDQRARTPLRAARVPLEGLPGWTRHRFSIDHDEGRYFRVMAVSVRAESREVPGWSQPLFEPVGQGVTAFLTRTIAGVPHLLVQARAEAGIPHGVQLAPTVQCTPGNYAHLPDQHRPPFLDAVLNADPARIRYEAVHSEEGGRFLNAESRYLLIDATEQEAPLVPPPGYRWTTLAQLTSLLRHSDYLNVQARTLLACVRAVPRGRLTSR